MSNALDRANIRTDGEPEARLEALIRSHDELPGAELELDAGDRERMRALGYLDDES